jgi:hypothetical protein
MTIIDEGPSLLACMAAAVEGHNALRKQALAPLRPGQVAINKLLSGDTKGALRVMQEIDKRAGTAPADADDDDETYEQMRHKRGDRIARERATVGKSITVLQRAEPKEAAMDDYITKLERQADALLAKLNRALGDADDNDADMEDTWSEHADAQASGNNASNDDDTEPDDDEDDDGDLHKDERYLDRGRGHQNMGPVRVNERFPPDPYQLGFVDVVGQGKRHKFDARVDLVAERDGVSRNEAMSRARQEFPESYADYQMWLAEQPTNQQHIRRSWGNDSRAAKGAATTYEDLVAQEMRKGCNYEIAGQRVMQTHGSAALRSRALGPRSDPARITKRLTQRIDELRADGLSGCEALRKLRLDREYFW